MTLLLMGGLLLVIWALLRRLARLQQRAEEQSASYRSLFEASGLAILIVGEDCIIREVNHAAEQLTGWSRDELVGQTACAELLAGAEGVPLGCPGLCPAAAHASHSPGDETTLLRMRSKTGGELAVTVSVSPLEASGHRKGHLFLIRDASERARLEAEAAVRRRQTEGLREIGLEIAALSDLEGGMERVLDRAMTLFGMDLVAWGILDEPTETIVWKLARGFGYREVRGAVLPVAGSVMGRILSMGRPFITHNLAGVTGVTPEGRALFANPPLKSAMAVPLRVRDQSYGVLLCAAAEVRNLTDEEVMLFTHLGSYLATAVENGQLLEQVQHMAALEERQRLARELHDSLGQTLTYVGVSNHMISRLADEGKTEAIKLRTANLQQVIQEAHTELRRSIFHLKESGDPRAPLADRWRELLRRFEEQSGIAAIYEVKGKPPARLPDPLELQVTRILQEALANVQNHSGARSVAVCLSAADQHLQITVADDGSGFDEETVHGPDQHHFGLSIMRERAAAAGAELEVQSTLGHGTTIRLRLDLRGKEG